MTEVTSAHPARKARDRERFDVEIIVVGVVILSCRSCRFAVVCCFKRLVGACLLLALRLGGGMSNEVDDNFAGNLCLYHVTCISLIFTAHELGRPY